MKQIGFIDYFLDEWHAQMYPNWIEQATNGEMKVAYAYAKVDAPHGIDNSSWCASRGIELLDSIEAVIDASDYLIVLSPDNPEFHEELATLPLKSGKPTYVDKTFASDRQTAMRLFDIAKQHGTPLFSSSALRFAKEYDALKRDEVEGICSIGPGKYDNYSIHQIEPIVALMGSKPAEVMFVGTERAPALMIRFGDGRLATMHHFVNSPFFLAVNYTDEDSKSVRVDSDFFAEFIKAMTAFFKTGTAPVDPEETIAIVSIIEYGFKAMATPFEWVKLPFGGE
ncbi:MAG: hypothetical protein K6T83_09375 [Alicyclobacillus sp.]|nr:hypothetical protein [Alicyclobacillus sp.]